MYVKNKMTVNPIVVTSTDVISKASDLMTEKNLHRIPVVDNGKLVGLVTKGLISSNVGGTTSLSIFELNYLLNKTPVRDIMIKAKKLVTIHQDELLEEAALLMLKHDIGCLPVINDMGELVGILTQNDLFAAFLDLLGWESGSRIVVKVKDGIGVIGDISKIYVKNNANMTHIGVYRTDLENCEVVIRTELADTKQLEKDLNENGFLVTSIYNKNNSDSE